MIVLSRCFLGGEECSYFTDEYAFLFSLYNIMGYRPTKLGFRSQDYEYAVMKCHIGLVIFGKGHDLVIHVGSKRGTGTIKPGTYSIPTGCRVGSACNFFAGSNPFNLSDMEVFYLSLSKRSKRL